MVRLRRVEFGVITELDVNGNGYIRCEKGDFVQFFYQNVCCALPGTPDEGRPVLQLLGKPTVPNKGLAVAFIAGQRGSQSIAEAYRWCPLCSYDAAMEEMEVPVKSEQASSKPVEVTKFVTTAFVPKARVTHGQKPVVRGPSGRPMVQVSPIQELSQAMDEATRKTG